MTVNKVPFKKGTTLLAVAGVAAFGIAACGSSSDSSSSDSSSTSAGTSSGASTTVATDQTVTITADATKLAFTQTAVNAKAGPATIVLDNPSATPHKLEVMSADGQDVGYVDPISQSTGSFNADLKPGTYTFVCNLPGHAATMHGTLTVK